jgi:O-antigen/teichoic acid export membrane protein
LLADLKHTLKHSGAYGLSRVASKALSFVFIPLYTNIYGAAGYADISLVETFWQILLTVCLFGFEITIITHCSPEKEENRKKLLFNFLTILLFNCAIFMLIGLTMKQNFSELLFKNKIYETVILYGFFVCIFETLLTIPLCIARLKNRPGLYTLISLSSLFLNFFLQIYFVYYAGKTFDFVFIAKIAAPAAVLALCIPFIISNVTVNFSKEKIKEILSFSVFLTVYAILIMLLASIDRFMLVYFVPMEEVGVYILGYNIGSITYAVIISTFSLAYSGIFYKKINDPNAERFFTKIATYLFFTMVFVSFCISLFIPEGLKLFVPNSKMWQSIDIIKIILFANCIYSLYFSFAFAFLYRKESKTITWVTLIVLIFNIAGNFIFIRYYGIYASAVLTVLSYLLFVIILYRKSRNYYFIKLETYKIILLSVLYIGLVYAASVITFDNMFYGIGFKLLLIALFFIILYAAKFFEGAELYAVKGAINKYLKINTFRKNS